MSMQTTTVDPVPSPPTETIIISTAAPPPEPRKPAVTTNNRGYFTRINKQNYASYAVFFLFIYGGMDLAASLGWSQPYSVLLFTEYSYCWFVGVIIGALAATLTMTFLPKLVYYVFGALMQLTGSIIFTAAPADYSACLAARYLAGLGIGLITVPFLIHNAEVASSNLRGVNGGMEQCGLALGICFQVIFTTEWTSLIDSNPNEIHGILGIIVSLFGLAMTALVIESPIFFLRRNMENRAKQSQEKLLSHNPGGVNAALKEARRYVAESDNRTLGEELVASVMPFLKMLLFRCFVAFSFSLPLTMSIISSTAVAEKGLSLWPIYLFGVLRGIGVMVAFLFLDTLGRKAVSLVGLLVMAGLMLGLAGLYANVTNLISFNLMTAACNIGLAFQVFAGLFVCSSSAYMGEAFPMRVKSFLVGVIVIIEQIVHIVLIACVSSVHSQDFFFQYFLAVGIIMLVGMVFFTVSMPETKKMTLRKAGQRFQKWYDLQMY
ncbi:probable polyol transporter 6 isoform X2 [Drosophila sechellia]|uniref:GM15147 n=1 Tax=Drosophila sechellia TaxID=7238 RepID=B4IBX8_DROSE|nr:probable polyol transporter 6 isoform X2 [Drosophila sechellia]EDW44886.1 GM15147 [Drosophila sechellia]